MVKLLVPTDFSEAANQALQFGAILGRALKAEMEIVHILEKVSGPTLLISIDEPTSNVAKEELEKLVKLIKESGYDQRINYRIIKGYVSDAIAQTAREIDADMVVMGTQGTTRMMELFLGSNTIAVLRKSQTPVLIIPPEVAFEPFTRIVLAIDGLSFNKDILRVLSILSKAFKSHIYAFHVAEDEQDLKYPQNLDELLSSCEYSYHSLINEHVLQSINQFVSEVQSNLLCLIRRQKSTFDRLFHGSTTRKEIFTAEIPLLILQD